MGKRSFLIALVLVLLLFVWFLIRLDAVTSLLASQACSATDAACRVDVIRRMAFLGGTALFSVIVIYLAHRRLANAAVSYRWLLPIAAALFLSVNFWIGLSIILVAPPGVIRLSIPIGLIWLGLLMVFVTVLPGVTHAKADDGDGVWRVAWWATVPTTMRALLNGILLAFPGLIADPSQAAGLRSLLILFAIAEIIGAIVFLVCIVRIGLHTRRAAVAA